MFTDLFVLVDNIDSARFIAPVSLIWKLRWKVCVHVGTNDISNDDTADFYDDNDNDMDDDADDNDDIDDDNDDDLWEVRVHGSADDDVVESVAVDVVYCHWVAKVGTNL